MANCCTLFDMDTLYDLAQRGQKSEEIPAAVQDVLRNNVHGAKHVQPALNVATVNGCVDAVNAILGSIPPSAKPMAMRKALLRAAQYGECAVLQVYIDQLDPAQTRRLAPQAILLAARGQSCNDFEGVLRLLTAACGEEHCGLETALDGAAAVAGVNVVRSLLAAKATLNGESALRRTILHSAVHNTNHCLGVMSALLEAKADVYDAALNCSVLYRALRDPEGMQDHAAVVRLLLSAGARADVKPSPLMRALRNHKLDMDIIRALLDANADPYVYENHQSAMGMLLAVSPVLAVSPDNRHFVVASADQPARQHTAEAARLLVSAKANVTLQHVKVASGRPHTFKTLMVIMGSCADRLGAKFTALAHVFDQDKMERLLATQAVGGDVSDVEAAHPGELCNAHCRKSGSVHVLKRLVSMRACVDPSQFKAMKAAARSNDPLVLDFMKAHGACMDEATLRLAQSEADIAGARETRAWIEVHFNDLRKKDRPSDEKRSRVEE